MSISVSQIRSLGEPIKQYNYDLVIPNIPGSNIVNGNILRIKTNNCTGIPGFGTDVQESTQYGFTEFYAGRGNPPGPYQITYEETLDARITKTLRNWYDLMWDVDTGIQMPSQVYKTEAVLRILNVTRVPVATIKFRGFFLESVDDSGLDGSSSGPVTVSATFRYSDWKFV